MRRSWAAPRRRTARRSEPAAEQAVIAALQGDEAVTAAIFVSGDGTQFNQLGLVSGHAYEVAGYDADPDSPTFGTFQLKNPWGSLAGRRR